MKFTSLESKYNILSYLMYTFLPLATIVPFRSYSLLCLQQRLTSFIRAILRSPSIASALR